MKLAYNQASRALGNTGENPAVGCVIVKNNELISLAHTNFNGRPHAERIALSNKKINFNDEKECKIFWSYANKKSKKHACTGIDYFIFRKIFFQFIYFFI